MSNSKRIKTANILLIVAPLLFFIIEAIAASAWKIPSYSYIGNYISDLGVPVVTVSQGRAVNSPLHLLMNIGFVSYALLTLLAIILLSPVLKGKRKKLGIGLAISHSVGALLVGLFPGYEWAFTFMHVIGAVLVIFGGNFAIMVLGNVIQSSFQLKRFRIISLALGILGLIGIAIVIYMASKNINYQGLFERVAIYPILLWNLMLGIGLRQSKIN